MLFLLIACAAGVYLWHHAPALLMLLVAGGVLWYVVIPLAIAAVIAITLVLVWGFVGLHWLANALPDWRIFRAPAPAPEIDHPIAARGDLLAIPLLLGLAAGVIMLCR